MVQRSSRTQVETAVHVEDLAGDPPAVRRREERDRVGDVGRLADPAEQLRVAEPEVLADQLSIIWEGTNSTAQAMGADGPPVSTRALVTAILDHHTRS